MDAPHRLRLATYNVSDLFGAGPLAAKGRKPKPEAGLAALAETLRAMDADVVALQEVQSQAVLDSFVAERLAGSGYPYRQVLATDPRGTHNVAILSRYPLSRAEIHPGVAIPAAAGGGMSRSVGEVQVDVPGFPLRLHDVHFKADPYYARPARPGEVEAVRETRLGEAHALLDTIRNEMAAIPAAHYVVMGDMNATPAAPEIQYQLHDGTVPLQDALQGRNDPEAWSHPVTQGRYDYVLLAPSVAAAARGARVIENPTAAAASDHRPLVVDLEIP